MTQFSKAEYDRVGHTTVKIANQVHGGRGGGMWSASILATDLRQALGDPHLLVGLAGDIKAGDRVLIASYLGEKEFADETRDMVGQLLITSVTRPDKAEPKRLPGSVSFRVLDLFLLGEKATKLVEDRGEIGASAERAKQRRAS